MINLISDTVTKPDTGMLSYMMAAEVGDDVFGADPSVQDLQQELAQMFGKEAGLFCPSGTMTNQIAIKVHTNPLDEIICDHYSHVYQYETAGYSFNSGVGVNLIHGTNGKITADQLDAAIKPVHDWLPISKLVVLENSCNKGGGSFYTLDEIKPIHKVCKEKNLKLHLDGARLFNVLVETGETTEQVGELFDSVSICMSKGLGAPVGSVLLGTKAFITQAKRFRKVMGGGMRQAGYLAAACSFALKNNIPQLKVDNDRAKELGEVLSTCAFSKEIRPIKTNIVIFDLVDGLTADNFLSKLEEKGILAAPFGPSTIRFVTHRDVSTAMIDKVKTVLKEINF